MEEKMKKIGRGMSLRMGITMSFFLSLTGTLTSGHFTVPGFLLSFLISTVISILIGFLIPIGKVTTTASQKLGLKPHSLPERLFNSFLSDLIYTPFLTFVMVLLAYMTAMRRSQGMAELHFWRMFLPSLVICMLVGYLLIFIFTPIYMKQLKKKWLDD